MSRQSRRYKHDYLMHHLEKGIDPPGFVIKRINDSKGRGVVAQKVIPKGEFLFEYRGKRLYEEPKNLEYVFELTHDMEKIWIDASEENGSVGRLVNDDHRNPNAYVTKMVINNIPHIVFWARQDIGLGEEITFNYDGSAKKTFDWRENEEKRIESSKKSSGEEWKAEDEDSEQSVEGSDKNVNDPKFKSKILNAWLKDQQKIAKNTNVQECQTKPKLTTTKPLTLRATRPRDSSTSRPHRPTKRLRKREPRKLNYEGSAKKTSDWRESEAMMSDLSEEVHSSGSEWLPDAELSKETDSITTSKFKARRTLSWVQDLQGLNICQESDDECSVIQPSERGRPTKRLPLHSGSKKRKRSCSNEPVIKRPKIIHAAQPKQKSTAKPKGVCHVCGKAIKNLNRHLREMHKLNPKKEAYAVSERGYIVKYCPLCGKSVERLRDHLKRTHRLEDDNIQSLLPGALRVKQADYLKRSKISKRNILVDDPCDQPCEQPSQNPNESGEIDVLPAENFKVKTFSKMPKSNTREPGSIISKITKRGILEPCDQPGQDPDESEIMKVTHAANVSNIETKTEKKNVNTNSESFADEETLLNFKSWLTTKCQKKEREAKQHCAQVFTVWQTVRSEGRRKLHDILDTDKIYELWYARQTNRPPGTVRSYLSSCCLFLDYLIVDGVSANFQQKCVACKTFLKTLSKSLSKYVSKRQVEIQAEDIQTMVTPSDVSKFLSSTQSEKARQILSNTHSFKGDSTMFALARDYVIFNILVRNGQRRGAILNITYKIFENALLTPDGATFVVTDHKTGHKAPANVAVDLSTYKLIKNYLMLCKLVPGNDCPNDDDGIFISWPQHAEKPKQLTNLDAMQNLWQTVTSKKITATKLRKAVSTTVREYRPDLREDLADHMNHLPSTADKYYVMKKTRDKAIGISKVISEVMTGDSENKTARSTTRIEINTEECTYSEFYVHWPHFKDDETISSTSVCPYVPGEIRSPSLSQRSMPTFVDVTDDLEISNFLEPELANNCKASTPIHTNKSNVVLEVSSKESVHTSPIIMNSFEKYSEEQDSNFSPEKSLEVPPSPPIVVTDSFEKYSEEQDSNFSPEESLEVPPSPPIVIINSFEKVSEEQGSNFSSEKSLEVPPSPLIDINVSDINSDIVAACIALTDGENYAMPEFIEVTDDAASPIIENAFEAYSKANDIVAIDNSSMDISQQYIPHYTAVPLSNVTIQEQEPAAIVETEIYSETCDIDVVKVDHAYSWSPPSPEAEQCHSPGRESVVTCDSEQTDFCNNNLYLSHRRRSFLKSESEQLISLSEDLIATGNIGGSAIVETLEGTTAGLALLDAFRARFGQELKTKLRDRLKTEVRKRAKLLNKTA